MTQGLRHVDPSGPPGRQRRVFSALATTRVFLFVSRHVSWKLDPLLLRLTRGRFATTLVIRTGLLETRGARTGALRRNAVIYWHDDDRVTIAASQAGGPRNPAWFHNLVANRDVLFAGSPMRATVVRGERERDRLWRLGDQVFPAFAVYRRWAESAGRTIPLIQLKPIDRTR
jgi:deazaflavin-dependent oxidoreductase (nitroreductase family)